MRRDQVRLIVLRDLILSALSGLLGLGCVLLYHNIRSFGKGAASRAGRVLGLSESRCQLTASVSRLRVVITRED